MIKFQQVEHVVKEAEETTNKVIDEPDTFQQIISLLEVIIWPIALIVILYLFKKQIGSIIDRFESADLSPTGLAFKLQKTTKLIGEGSSAILPKSGGGGINPKDGGGINPKDGGGINPKERGGISPKNEERTSFAESPYQELMELHDAINQKLIHIATQKGIHNMSGYSNFALTNNLTNQRIIDKHTSSKLKALIELNTLGLNSPEITHDQVTQMKRLFNNISF